MVTPERLNPEKTVLEDVGVLRVGALQQELLPKLAAVYFQTWNPEGLCGSLSEATDKMAAFNPKDTYVVISRNRLVYALIQTLPVSQPSLADLLTDYPNYQTVERASRDRGETVNPKFVICFSINVLPGYEVRISETETQPLVLYLLNNLPTPPRANRVAYSRFNAFEGSDPVEFYCGNLDNTRAWGPVGLHELKGVTTHIIKEGRPEDLRGGGYNVTVVYPKTPEEAAHFNRLKLRRRLKRPETVCDGNVITFVDTIDLCL